MFMISVVFLSGQGSLPPSGGTLRSLPFHRRKKMQMFSDWCSLCPCWQWAGGILNLACAHTHIQAKIKINMHTHPSFSQCVVFSSSLALTSPRHDIIIRFQSHSQILLLNQTHCCFTSAFPDSSPCKQKHRRYTLIWDWVIRWPLWSTCRVVIRSAWNRKTDSNNLWANRRIAFIMWLEVWIPRTSFQLPAPSTQKCFHAVLESWQVQVRELFWCYSVSYLSALQNKGLTQTWIDSQPLLFFRWCAEKSKM